MSNADRKKQRQRMKRQEKRALQRRAASVNPLRRIGLAGDQGTCYVNRDWRTQGIISLQVLRPVPGRGHAFAAFLIDTFCLGLKDAFGRMEMPAQAFHDHMRRSNDDDVELVPCDLATARRLVAGGVRWAHDHNFRLPHRWERWAAILGDIGDWRTADVSGFGKDGKLCYIGRLEDLHRRLIGCTVEEFMARDDVEIGAMELPREWVEGPDAGAEDEGDEDDRPDQEVLRGLRRACFDRGIQPHPLLPKAVRILAMAMAEAASGDNAATQDPVDLILEKLNRAITAEPVATQADLAEALAQVMGLLRSAIGSGERLELGTAIPAIGQPEPAAPAVTPDASPPVSPEGA